jgi:hypothetical protein
MVLKHKHGCQHRLTDLQISQKYQTFYRSPEGLQAIYEVVVNLIESHLKKVDTLHGKQSPPTAAGQ